MAIRHYVLLATDGHINLPTVPDLCPPPPSPSADVCPPDSTKRLYIFGFTGGLYQVIENGVVTYNDPNLDWTDSTKWQGLLAQMGKATIPAPMIWAEVGDHLYITLINLGMKYRPDLLDFHTVHLHGAHVATQLDGFPESAFGVPMWMDTANDPPVATYFFQPEHPGTQMYHCHVEASEHVQMGMYGALVIYPSMASLNAAGITNENGMWLLNGQMQHQIPSTATNRNFAYNDINSYFDKEYVMLLSDIDSVWHDTIEASGDFKAANFKPDFWLVNGRCFPDTIRPHPLTPPVGSDPNLTQINYESYVHVKTNQKFLLRMINMGYQVVPWHIHGWHFTIVGKDSNVSPFLKIAAQLNLDLHHHEGLERGFTVTLGSGETYDLLITADDKRPIYREYIVNGQDGFDSLCTQMNTLSTIDSGSIFSIPTEPVDCISLNLVDYLNICDGTQGVDNFFPQFYPMHNHDDYKVTNSGIDTSTYPGGQLTLIQTDAPDTPIP